jgi:hypothetical protein
MIELLTGVAAGVTWVMAHESYMTTYFATQRFVLGALICIQIRYRDRACVFSSTQNLSMHRTEK